MIKNTIDIQIAIQNLESQLSKASSQFHQWEMTCEDWYDPSWLIESCFLQLLTVTEALDLPEIGKMAYEDNTAEKGSERGVT